MKKIILFLFLLGVFNVYSQKVFDTHIHGEKDPSAQMLQLENSGVYKAAISTSWDLQNTYRKKNSIELLYGLMLPCPNGKVPYGDRFCFSDGKEWPDIKWVEEQIKIGKIDFIGEILNQYYGISPSDKLLYPYYELAEKYNLPVGIHSGLAGPNHGCPNFRVSMGSPILMEDLLLKFPKLKVWIMHAGSPFLEDTIGIMSVYQNVYTDISVISNPYIVSYDDFRATMKRLIDAGLENRLMFGSDNGDIKKAIESVDKLDFLSLEQKEKILHKNAEHFFKK
ncbi:amidohydrolase family protein [Flavobacterium denitrificans]|uniref:amidohydrolase family protein n=1 Tax=Flavobacterium denitrificans TaxID=281361 RepID=UPI00042839CE|nr:amidohydrolase family protein [Flavobacterium denitrificans]